VAVNGAGNTLNGQTNRDPHGDLISFAPVPEPGPQHGEALVRFFSSLPAVQDQLPAADVIFGSLIGTEQADWADCLLG
jgi:hypothetical protein